MQMGLGDGVGGRCVAKRLLPVRSARYKCACRFVDWPPIFFTVRVAHASSRGMRVPGRVRGASRSIRERLAGKLAACKTLGNGASGLGLHLVVGLQLVPLHAT